MSKANKTTLEILYEDNHLLAVNKPGGMLAQGDKTGDISLVDKVKDYLIKRYNKPGEAFVGLVHRLDRPVSGVVVLTKTSKALTRMNRIFLERQVTKCYWALTTQPPPNETGTLVHWLKKNESKNRTISFRRETKGAKQSELEYSLKKAGERKYLIEVHPLTGRPHQIRVQLSAIGCHILGDVKYGFQGAPSTSIALHAKSLQFIHPVKKEPLLIEAPLPKSDIWRFFR